MKDSAAYLEHILDAIGKIRLFDDGVRDAKTLSAIERQIGIIGEAANNIPKDMQLRYPDIPWSKVIGMRHIIVHHYFGVHEDTIWETVDHYLPELEKDILAVFEQEKNKAL